MQSAKKWKIFSPRQDLICAGKLLVSREGAAK
jgi:hypothetical protein